MYRPDVLVFATGFRVDRFMRPMNLIGRHGIALEDSWKNGPYAYIAISVPEFPDFFRLNCPNGPVGNIALIDVAEQRCGGEGVIKVSTRDRMNLNSLIHYYVRAFESYARREPIMVQEYLKSVKQDGDIRILLLNGEIIGAMRRKPKKGDFRTNVHAGGEVFAHQATARENRICQVIKDKLIADGLYFVGIDIIGGKLVEIIQTATVPRRERWRAGRRFRGSAGGQRAGTAGVDAGYGGGQRDLLDRTVEWD